MFDKYWWVAGRFGGCIVRRIVDCTAGWSGSCIVGRAGGCIVGRIDEYIADRTGECKLAMYLSSFAEWLMPMYS